MKMCRYSLILLMCFIYINAQNDTTLTDVSVFPVLGYSPETKMIFGAVGNIVFKNTEEDKKPSYISPLFIYTTRKQYTIGLFSNIYSENKKHITETAFEYTKFPNSIFPPNSDEEEPYTPKTLTMGLVYSYEIKEHIFTGVRYIYKNYEMEKYESGGIIDRIFNKDHTDLSGFGLSTTYDSRNHLFTPSSGLFSTFIWTNYGEVIGSKSAYSTYDINHNQYFTVSENLVFAYQTLMSLKFGDVPFYELNTLGNQNNLRGYNSGKYYGKHKFSFQGEFRKNFLELFEVVLFAGMGNTSNEVKESFSHLKSTFGFGFRYYLDPKNKVPLRLDMAWGESGSSGFYITLMQAF